MSAVRIADCRRAVGRFYNVTREEMLSESRPRRIARPRMIVMLLARELTAHRFPRFPTILEIETIPLVWQVCAVSVT